MKRCTITGAANGIGRALALRYASEGYIVVGFDRDEAGIKRTENEVRSSGGSVSFLRTDLGDPEDIRRALENIASGPPLEVMIFNAGINHVGRFENLDNQETLIEVNLVSPIVMTAGLLRRGMVEQGGSLVFISSLSHYVSYPGAAVYGATKTGLASFSRSVSAA